MSLRLYLFLLLSFAVSASVTAQKRGSEPASDYPATRPRLVVGIVVDQMRYDYLTRFWDHFGNDGFKRLIKEGFLGKNHHFNYVPTSTGPGHASVYTGTTPANHGIIGNDWFDKDTGEIVYCASDTTVATVGGEGSVGQMSPHRLMASTITDQLRLHSQMRSKVIAVALKDRGSVLPGGHTANAAYWFAGGSEGNWITSTYYMEQLPSWVQEYNTSRSVNQYRRIWDTQQNMNTYLESGPDNNSYEGPFAGKTAPVFPYDIPMLWNDNGQYDLLKETPFGNSMTTDFALLALEKEALGKDAITDFLAISYSSTDYIGHRFGVHSKEVQDAYIRLDLELARLLETLDKEVGEGEYTLFLSADHGAMHAAGYLSSLNIPSGSEEPIASREEFLDYISFAYGSRDIVRNISNRQIFLDHKLLRSLELNPAEVQEAIAAELLNYEGIARTYTAVQMRSQPFAGDAPFLLQNSYNQTRSGDVFWVPAPGYAGYKGTGSTHGSPHNYDTHVPLILYGAGIRQGSTTARTEIPDIAPTIATLLGIAYPNGATGKPVTRALE